MYDFTGVCEPAGDHRGHCGLGLYKKRVMWKWIVLYWCVLTVKNVVDLFAK
ncbi:MAG: hypothetical protein IJ461_05905 [Clostridia bacterium]|nr:hypothetical protein [Clostridia bacterium]